MTEVNMLVLQVIEDSLKMQQDMTRLLEAVRNESLYVSISEAEKLSGMDKRSIRYYAQNKTIRTREINPTVKLYHVEDVMNLTKQRRTSSKTLPS